MPQAVKRLQEAVQHADAVLFAVTETNSSLSAALKNAIDWCTMPNSFDDKPAAMMGVGHGGGTATAQQQLRQVSSAPHAELNFSTLAAWVREWHDSVIVALISGSRYVLPSAG